PEAEPEDMGPAGLNRRKKTPEEIAAENEAAEQDDLTSKSPAPWSQTQSIIAELLNNLLCSLQSPAFCHGVLPHGYTDLNVDRKAYEKKGVLRSCDLQD